MRSHSYLNSATKIIESYDGNIPLSVWLKEYFRVNKKFGSRDRREVSHICYCFFRLGNSFADLGKEERMLTAVFLCSENSNLVLQELRPAWNEHIGASLHEKLQIVNGGEEVGNIFTFISYLSKEIDARQFLLSHLLQPSLFLRIRPGATERVLEMLNKAGVDYNRDGNCLELANGAKVDSIITVDKDVVVQDLNSQKTLDPLQTISVKPGIRAWDCCAASGGKSILLHDLFPNIHITVSDIRESILANLKKRFAIAGIRNYNDFIADVSSVNFSINSSFDLIICDAPCSGSGTWGRTPEQLSFFTKEKIDYYSSLQKKIALNSVKRVRKGGVFIYITCSVFSAENEDVVAYLSSEKNLQLISKQYLKGYNKRADTLFVALFSL